MKKFIQNFLCKCLEMLGASVAINLEISGTLKCRTDDCYYYSNDLKNAKVLDCNDDVIQIPSGKFHLTIKKRNN